MTGTLILCATPIGNLEDLSERATYTLRNADVIFAEDTRRTGLLLKHIGASVPMKSFHAHNEQSRLAGLVAHLEAGNTVVLVSDAGMPTLSDPGMAAVQAAADVGATVTVVPGPSAVTSALAVSGFDGDRFVFEGFLPRKGRGRTEVLQSIGSARTTVVFFASPKRVVKDLTHISGHCNGTRRVVLARELTKLHEEIWRGTLADAVEHWGQQENIRGEFTVVLDGAAEAVPDMERAKDAAEDLISQGSTASDAVRVVASATGVSRRQLYDLVIRPHE